MKSGPHCSLTCSELGLNSGGGTIPAKTIVYVCRWEASEGLTLFFTYFSLYRFQY